MLAIVFASNTGDKCQQLFVAKTATNVSNSNFQKCQHFCFPEMLTITTCRTPGNMFSEMLVFITSRSISNRNPGILFYEMLAIIIISPEMLAIINSRDAGNSNFMKCQPSYLLEVLATNVSNYFFRKWRRMLTIIIFRNVSNYNFHKCWRQMLASVFSEIPAMNLSYYNFQKYWRQMLLIRKSRNAGDNFQQL